MSSSSSSLKQNPEKQAKNEYIPHFIAKRPFYDDRPTEGGDYRMFLLSLSLPLPLPSLPSIHPPTHPPHSPPH